MTPAERPGRRWLAHPFLSGVIAASWLLMRGSLAPADWLWAAILGLGLPALLHRWIWPGTYPRAGWTALRLLVIVLWDVIVANFSVARLVLSPRRQPRPAWVSVHHALHDPRAIWLLATIITTTPGTVSCSVDEGGGVIHVHALDAPDTAAVAAQIRERYERPLQEIFG